jgi:glutamyl endopeptidase
MLDLARASGESRAAMIELKSVHKPASAFESMEAAPAAPPPTKGHAGAAAEERSRSLAHLVVTGKSGPIAPPFESVIGADERVRILDTDLPPWRMICALRMRGPTGAGAIGTGWFIGPRTVLTAGHCVFSNHFFGGWASSIEVIPGLLGAGPDDETRPYGSVTSEQFSSIDRWTETEDADFDMGCIHLDEPKGDEAGWFALAAPDPEALVGYLVNVSGYPADRGGGSEQYHGSNRVLRVTERRLFYEVDTYGGQSGAPVWIHENEGAPPLAVGIHAYGVGGTPADLAIEANSAPRIIPEVLDKLKEWVEQDGGWPGA